MDSSSAFSNQNPVLDALEQVGLQAKMDPERQFRLGELLGHCNHFITESKSWRQSSFEKEWHLYRNNCDGIYNKDLANRKESWQSKVAMPLTPTHKENIQAALYRMMFGAEPSFEMKRRYEDEEFDQSENIRDIILREMEKSRFKVEFAKILDDALTYGSGFARMRFEQTYETRKVRSPEQEQVDILNPASIMRSFRGQLRTIGYQENVQPVRTYRGVKFEYLSIWDIFPDPKAFEIKGNPIAYRYYATFGEIVKGVKEGYYFPEAIEALRNAPGMETESQEKALQDADRAQASSTVTRTDYGKRLECFEKFARLPKKWVLLHGEPIDDPDELVPARVLFHNEVVLAVEAAEDYQGEPPIYKMDYFPVASRFYGRGIAEMVAGLQEVVSETVNQRIDNVALVMNRMLAVIEKAIINRGDLVSKPGGVIRLDAKYVQDIRQAVMEFSLPDVTQSSYKDVTEMERYAQDRTSNRTNLGSGAAVGDAANKTLGGLEMIQRSAGEKFAFIGMLIEHIFMYEVIRGYWKTIYANIEPDDVINALGNKRAATFKLMTPEEIEQSYVYVPQGLFTMENKAQTQIRVAGVHQEFGQYPWFDAMGAYEKVMKANNFDPDSMRLKPEEMQMMMQAQQMMQGQVSPDLGASVPGLGQAINNPPPHEKPKEDKQ